MNHPLTNACIGAISITIDMALVWCPIVVYGIIINAKQLGERERERGFVLSLKIKQKLFCCLKEADKSIAADPSCAQVRWTPIQEENLFRTKRIQKLVNNPYTKGESVCCVWHIC